MGFTGRIRKKYGFVLWGWGALARAMRCCAYRYCLLSSFYYAPFIIKPHDDSDKQRVSITNSALSMPFIAFSQGWIYSFSRALRPAQPTQY